MSATLHDKKKLYIAVAVNLKCSKQKQKFRQINTVFCKNLQIYASSDNTAYYWKLTSSMAGVQQ